MKCHQQQYYFEVEKVQPTVQDGNAKLGGKVLGFSKKNQYWEEVSWMDVTTRYYSHWMQMPKAPSDNDAHAFLD